MSKRLHSPYEKRGADCLSDFAIDALVAGDVDSEKEKSQREHLVTCDDCRARFENASHAAEDFSRDAPELNLPIARKNKPNNVRVLYAASSVFAIAAAILFFVRFGHHDPETDLTTRLKGSSHIGFYVKHGAEVSPGTIGAHVHAGDALRFTYATTSSGYLAILSVDGAKNASVYYPDGPTAQAIEPASNRALSSSTILDDTVGHETLYGFFCDKPIALEPVRAALAANSDHAPVVDGCTVDTIAFDKDPNSTP